MEKLQIRLFGELSFTWQDRSISDRDNRSRKVWHLMAYLLCRRDRIVTSRELIEQLWGEDTASDNPENALKVTLHRARQLLDRLWDGAGHALIRRKGTGYVWNREVETEIDTERFEALCASEEPAAKLQALSLYRGDFLGNAVTGPWSIPLATHYHNLYVATLEKLIPDLAAQGEQNKIITLCRSAVPLEPYNETICCHLMEALMATKAHKEAAEVYETLRGRLFHDFGISPGEKARSLYRRASNNPQDQFLPMETVLEHLLEQDSAAGALECEFNCFKVLCHAEARAMLRSGNATHVALLSVSGAGEKILSKRSIECAMEHLNQEIRTNLRRGDAYSQCSGSQFVVMLPRANYENSCVVCRRVINAFYRRHPHSPAQIHYMVRPLNPVDPDFR